MKHKAVHRDLKSANVLLSKENDIIRGKVADFGTSRFASHVTLRRRFHSLHNGRFPEVDDTNDDDATKDVEDDCEDKVSDVSLSMTIPMGPMACGIGTPTHMAPEMWNVSSASESHLLTEKVDVYSFGIVMWEVLTMLKPWANLRFGYLVAEALGRDERPIVESKRDCYKDAFDALPPSNYIEVMTHCWSSRPHDRPSFVQVRETFRPWRSYVDQVHRELEITMKKKGAWAKEKKLYRRSMTA